MNLENYLAKPTESIFIHNNNLHNCVKILKDLGYLKDKDIEELLNICIDCHDLGKINEEFQKRVLNHSKFNEEKEVYHNILSIFLINQNLFESKEDYYRCLHIVLNHHNYCNPFLIMKNQMQLIKDLLKDFDTFQISAKTKFKMKEYICDEKAIITKGLLHKCDYAASAHLDIEYKNDFLEESLEKFKNEHNFNWNELQKFSEENRDKNIITIAQTGMGKTEASLLWSGNNKLFFFLPLQVTNNSIYRRIKDLISRNVDNKLGLLHSNNLEIYNEDEDSNILEHYKLSKQFSLPINVSTIDQLFDFVFRYPGYELKLATLSYSKIVVDEIQMYDPRLLATLIYGLEMVVHYGGKVNVTTATLAPFIKDKLMTNIDLKIGTFTNDLVRHNLKIYKEELNSEKIIDYYMKHKTAESCKILVVVNTVKKAQEVYQQLTKYGIENIHLLHSKFNKTDRLEKEKEIIEDGKTEVKKCCVWISTQIVEASLDIDFDTLFTELSDLSGLFQRLGRCNRKGKKFIEDYNCFVFTEINKKIIGKVVDKTIYNLSKTAIESVDGKLTETEKLNLINNTFTTEKIKDSDYYREYMRQYNQLKNLTDYDLDKNEVDLREIHSYTILPMSIYEEMEEEIKEIIIQLQSQKMNVVDKMKLENKIKNLCISVQDYEFKNIHKNLITELCMNKYEKICVVNCEYDNQVGFRWRKNEEKFL